MNNQVMISLMVPLKIGYILSNLRSDTNSIRNDNFQHYSNYLLHISMSNLVISRKIHYNILSCCIFVQNIILYSWKEDVVF